jgi:hypothetical protein
VDPEQDDVVVARQDVLFDAAVEPGARALDQHRPVRGGAPVHAHEAVAVACRELPAGGFLVDAEHTDTDAGRWRSRGQVVELWAMQTETSGRIQDTEVNELAARPSGVPSASAAIAVTPVRNAPKIRRS